MFNMKDFIKAQGNPVKPEHLNQSRIAGKPFKIIKADPRLFSDGREAIFLHTDIGDFYAGSYFKRFVENYSSYSGMPILDILNGLAGTTWQADPKNYNGLTVYIYSLIDDDVTDETPDETPDD